MCETREGMCCVVCLLAFCVLFHLTLKPLCLLLLLLIHSGILFNESSPDWEPYTPRCSTIHAFLAKCTMLQLHNAKARALKCWNIRWISQFGVIFVFVYLFIFVSTSLSQLRTMLKTLHQTCVQENREEVEESFFLCCCWTSSPQRAGVMWIPLIRGHRRFDLGIEHQTHNVMPTKCFTHLFKLFFLWLRYSFESCICRELDLFWYM